MMRKHFILSLLLASSALLFFALPFSSPAREHDSDDGPDDALTIDRSVIGSDELNFPNDKHIYPKQSNFEILHYVLMSSDSGERWATVTLRNRAAGGRKLEQDHIMALFADGRRKPPAHFKRHFAADETLSFTLSFGHSKFPLLSVYTRK